MKNSIYRIIHFLKPNRYVGLAWNYNEAILVSTKDFETYTQAYTTLETECANLGIELKWFDGEYQCVDGETLISKLD